MEYIDTPNIEQAKKALKTSQHPKIVSSQNESFDRAILEYGNFDILVLSLHNQKNDKPKQLDIGINHIIASIAARKNVAFALDFSDIRSLAPSEQARALARFSFLISVCRRAKAKTLVLNARDSRGAQALMRALGASSQQAKQETFS